MYSFLSLAIANIFWKKGPYRQSGKTSSNSGYVLFSYFPEKSARKSVYGSMPMFKRMYESDMKVREWNLNYLHCIYIYDALC